MDTTGLDQDRLDWNSRMNWIGIDEIKMSIVTTH